MARHGTQPHIHRWALVGVGAGLVLLGVALFLPGVATTTAAPAAEERSVIPVEVNYPAPELSLSKLGGGQEALKDYRGKVVLLNNWATWCPPCKAEMPTLKAFHDAHAIDGFSVIAVEAGDPEAQVQAFAKSFGLGFPIWLDPKNASLTAFQNENLPNSVVIDRKGQVRLAWVGEISRTVLEKYVTPIIGEQ